MTFDLVRRTAAELFGTALLLATVVGSGIMADRLTEDVAQSLLRNTIPTGAILVVLITVLGPISGARFGPLVTMIFALRRRITATESLAYGGAHVVCRMLGSLLAPILFPRAVFEVSQIVRSGCGQRVAEAVATFGLVATILAGMRFRRDAIPRLVGLSLTAAYWFSVRAHADDADRGSADANGAAVRDGASESVVR